MRSIPVLREEKWKDRCDRYFSSIADNEPRSNNTRRELLPPTVSSEISKCEHKEEKTNNTKWLSSLNLHGSGFLGLSESKYSVFFWLAIIFSCMAFFGLFTYLMVVQYINQVPYLRMTRSSSNENVLDRSLSVTFCNLNVLRVSQLSATRLEKLRNLQPAKSTDALSERTSSSLIDMLKTSNLWKTLQVSLGNNLTSVLSSLEEEFAAYEDLVSENDMERLYQSSLEGDLGSMYDGLRLSRSEILELGHQKRDMLRHCWIDGRACFESESIVNPNALQGNCVTIKNGVNKAFDHLTLLLDAQPYEYVGVTSPVPGFVVSVHDSIARHQEAKQFIVSPGENLKIRLEEVIKYEKVAECNSELGYNQKVCQRNCLEKYVVDLCGCSVSFDSSLRSKCRLNTPYEFICRRSLEYMVNKNLIQCPCLKRCSETRYQSYGSTGTWPSQFHSVHVERSLANKGISRTNAQIKDSMVKIDVDTTKFEYRKYTEVYDITWLDLVWRVGGLSAILLGISAVTVIELIWLIGKGFNACCTKTSEPKTESPQLKIQIEEETRSKWATNNPNNKATHQPSNEEPPALPRRPTEHQTTNMVQQIKTEVQAVTNNNILVTNNDDDYDEIDHIYSQVWDPMSTTRSRARPENNVNAALNTCNQLSRKRSHYNIKVSNTPVTECQRNYFLRVEGSAPLNHATRGSVAPHLLQTYSSQQTRLVTGSRPGIFYM